MSESAGSLYWKNLGSGIETGQMYLDPDMARVYSDAITTLANEFREAQKMIRDVAQVEGLGDFDCADELEKYLRDVLHNHPGSITTVLGQYIDRLGEMDDAVSKAIATTVEADGQVAAAVTKQGQQ